MIRGRLLREVGNGRDRVLAERLVALGSLVDETQRFEAHDPDVRFALFAIGVDQRDRASVLSVLLSHGGAELPHADDGDRIGQTLLYHDACDAVVAASEEPPAQLGRVAQVATTGGMRPVAAGRVDETLELGLRRRLHVDHLAGRGRQSRRRQAPDHCDGSRDSADRPACECHPLNRSLFHGSPRVRVFSNVAETFEI